MSNIKILYNNIYDLASSVVASNTAGSLNVANLTTETKSHTHRSTGTSVSFTLNWSTNQELNCIILPCTNLSATATIRVRLYDSVDSLLWDSTAIIAVPGLNINTGTRAYNANAFAFGFLSKTAVYTDTLYTTVRKCVIDLVDTSSSVGYIDTSKILVGKYWQPEFNIENGVQLLTTDNSIISRTNAGELVTDLGFVYDKINFNYTLLPETDRTELAKIIKLVGTNKNFFVSLFPEYEDDTAEQDFMIYGKRSNSSLTYRTFGFYNHSMEIVSW